MEFFCPVHSRVEKVKSMVKKLLFFVLFCSALIARSIDGFWKSIDEKTGEPRCVVAIYSYQGVYYGRMIGTFDDQGKMKDDIYHPKERAPGVFGNPYYCGMDFIWDLRERDESYRGRILDPEEGNVYNAELWVEKGKLMVKGKLMFFSRTQAWKAAVKADFPRGFKMPDVKQFVPLIPEGH